VRQAAAVQSVDGDVVLRRPERQVPALAVVRRGPSRQFAHEQQHPEPRRDESREDNRIGHEHDRHAELDERQADQCRQKHCVREQKRPCLGIVDVGVEEVRRVERQLMRHPRDPPHVEIRVDVGRHAQRMNYLRPGEDGRQEYEEGGGSAGGHGK